MNVPREWVHQSQLPDFRSLYQYVGPESSNVGLRGDIVNAAPPAQDGIPWGALLLGGLHFVSFRAAPRHGGRWPR